MADQMRRLHTGDPVPEFALPAANREGMVSLADLRGRPFLIGFFRGLYCPFCRRQVEQLAGIQPALQAAGIETLAVFNTPVERARLYFRYRPSPVVLLCDPDCISHHAFGVPQGEFRSEGSSEPASWPHRASIADFQAARINPTGELPEPLQPMEANAALNAQDGFELDELDKTVLADHATQLVGHFLVDADGIVGWAQIEAPDGPGSLCTFPTASQSFAAANNLER